MPSSIYCSSDNSSKMYIGCSYGCILVPVSGYAWVLFFFPGTALRCLRKIRWYYEQHMQETSVLDMSKRKQKKKEKRKTKPGSKCFWFMFPLNKKKCLEFVDSLPSKVDWFLLNKHHSEKRWIIGTVTNRTLFLRIPSRYFLDTPYCCGLLFGIKSSIGHK